MPALIGARRHFTLAPSKGVGAAYAGSLLDANYAAGRFWFAGTRYGDEAGLNTAIGATKSGVTRTISAKETGAELLANSDFATDITGWSPNHGYESTTDLSWDAGRIKAVSLTTTQTRFLAPWSSVLSKAYRVASRLVSTSGDTGASFVFKTSTGGGTQFSLPHTAGVQNSAIFGAVSTDMCVSGVFNHVAIGKTVLMDDFSVKEVVPLVGHNYLAFGAIIKGTTPAVASGNKVAFQADANNERDRVRLVWGSDKHLKLIVSFENADVATLDLGVVDVSTPFTVELSSSLNDFMARLNTAAPLFDASGNHPGLAMIRIGRSFTGETWDGGIDRVTVFNAARGEAFKLAMWGDSLTASLAASIGGYSGGRPTYNGGIGGEPIDTIAARMLADTTYRDRITVLWDRMNTGDTNANYAAKMAQMVARVRERHDRFIIVSDINKTDGTEDPGSAWRIAQDARNAALAATYPGHFVDVVAALDNNALRSDGLHLTGPGNQIAGDAILALALANGW